MLRKLTIKNTKNEQTWKKIVCPPLTNTDKIARGVSEKRLKLRGELKCNISFMGKIHKSKVYVLFGSVFGTDWIVSVIKLMS